jgi:tape measure domain-containing protein
VAVVANVAINVDSRGAPAKLKQVADRSKQVEKAVQGMNGDLRRSQREFKGAGNAANQAASGFGKLGKAIAGVATVAAAFQALKFTVVKTAELETQTRSLKVLTGSLETAQKIVQQLQDIGAVTPFTSTELIDTAKRLRAFGVETEKLVDTTRRLGDVAGATGADLGGIATAFGQIQAKGRLQGEELLQLQERGIDLQSELQRMYGLTGEEFRKALEKGRFSAEAVDVALQNLTNTGGKYANGAIAQSDTLAGKFSTLQDGITRTAQVIGQVLSPALQTILDQAIGVVNSINNALSAGRRIQQFGIDAQQRNQLFQQAGEEAEEIARLRGGGRIDPAVFTQLRDERFRDLIERYGYETGQIQVETQAPTLGAPKVPELLGGGGGGARGGARGGRSGPSPEDILARQTEVGAQLLQQKEREFALAVEQDPLMKELLRISYERVDAEERVKDAAAEQRDELLRTIQQVEQAKAGLAVGKSLAESLIGTTEQLDRVRSGFAEGIKIDEQLNQQADMFKQTMQGAGDIIGNQLRGAIDGLIDGTADWNSILQDTLKQLGGFLIKFGLNALAGSDGIGILSFLGFGTRANGGPVNANEPYIVGERGPELFIPFQRGQVVSNEDTQQLMGQAQTVSLPFTRTSERLAAMQDPGAIDVRYESTVINNTEYVTAEQHRKGMAQAAERGRALTLQALQNSPRTRTKVGI